MRWSEVALSDPGYGQVAPDARNVTSVNYTPSLDRLILFTSQFGRNWYKAMRLTEEPAGNGCHKRTPEYPGKPR
ncbi:hypothetical protein Are01nite_15120 [Actinoplanes regularis]|nr:hypothetical protein Are01nite_15120 [Actinoplanes regularis]